jgi:hypothetical protein
MRQEGQALPEQLYIQVWQDTWPTGPAQPSPAQPSPAQPSPAQPSPAQPSPAQPSPAQPSPARPTGWQPGPWSMWVCPTCVHVRMVLTGSSSWPSRSSGFRKSRSYTCTAQRSTAQHSTAHSHDIHWIHSMKHNGCQCTESETGTQYEFESEGHLARLWCAAHLHGTAYP